MRSMTDRIVLRFFKDEPVDDVSLNLGTETNHQSLLYRVVRPLITDSVHARNGRCMDSSSSSISSGCFTHYNP